MLSFGPRGMRSRRRRRTTIGMGERAARERQKGRGRKAERQRERKKERETRERKRMRCGYKKKERNAEDAEEHEEGGERTEEVGWPKVARVEYWNALPEAISVRCPPFVLLSCPLQASSSFPSPSLSLSSFLFVSPFCLASLPFPLSSLFAAFLSQSYAASFT